MWLTFKYESTMAKITVRPHGLNGGVAGPGNKTPPPRDVIRGWSIQASRRNRQFLQSIELARVQGTGVFLTLTLRDLPPTSADWTRLVSAFLKRMRRTGIARYHWVVEFQRRGVPHLHVVAYWEQSPSEILGHDPVGHWLAVAEPFGADPKGQEMRWCDQRVELLAYMAKHSARTADHYQRARMALPVGWHSVGRLWGASSAGSWPTSTLTFDFNDTAFYRLRRLYRGYVRSKASTRLAIAQGTGDGRQVEKAVLGMVHARRLLKCNDRLHSRIRPLGTWMPESVAAQMVVYTERQAGCVVEDLTKDPPEP